MHTSATITWLLFCLSNIPAWGTEPGEIVGEWVTAGGSSRVMITRQDDKYVGRIVALKHSRNGPNKQPGIKKKPQTDTNNPDATLRQRPLIGLLLLNNFHFDGDGWSGGTIYDPNNGKTYKAEISLADKRSLYVRGYIGVSLIGRTTIWESLNSYRKRELAFLELNCEQSNAAH